jgi:hypothetical protein
MIIMIILIGVILWSYYDLLSVDLPCLSHKKSHTELTQQDDPDEMQGEHNHFSATLVW